MISPWTVEAVGVTLPAMKHRILLPLVLAVATLACVRAGNRPFAAVEMRRDGKLLFAPVRIDGRGPFWFCVDSGASHTVLDPRLAKQLGLQAVGAGTTRGTGTGDVAVGHLRPLVMSLGRARVAVREPWMIDLSGVPIPQWTMGLIGADLFERFVVELDPEQPRLAMYEPRTFRVAPGAAAVPLLAREHRFYVPVTIELPGRRMVEREARIDTGSEESVADEIVREARQVRKSVLGQGLGADYEGVSGLFDAIRLGPFEIRDVWGPGAPKTGIGMEVFRRFVTTFDVAGEKLYLRPNGHLAEPVPTPPGP
jgi:Aspartyl protease